MGQEELSRLRRKLEKQRKVEVYADADQILQEEIKEYRVGYGVYGVLWGLWGSMRFCGACGVVWGYRDGGVMGCVGLWGVMGLYGVCGVVWGYGVIWGYMGGYGVIWGAMGV